MLVQSSKLLLVAAVCAMGIQAADNSIGTWKRNAERSKYDAPNAPKNPIVSQTVVREAMNGGVKTTSKGCVGFSFSRFVFGSRPASAGRVARCSFAFSANCSENSDAIRRRR